jgi:hypothetical protein
VITFATGSSGASTGGAGQAFLYTADAPAFTPSTNGQCSVTVSAEVKNSGSALTGYGPFFRVAIRRTVAGAFLNTEDGHLSATYMQPSPVDGDSAPISRTVVVPITAGEETQFGAYLGSIPSSWNNRDILVNVSYICF